MKVYLLMYSFPYESSDIVDIFSTYESAEAARKKMRPRKYYEVVEWEVNEGGT